MRKNIQNKFLFLILPFCFLVPLTHGMQGTFDDEKSSDASDDYTISNPLVLIVGIQEYPYCDYDDLSGVFCKSPDLIKSSVCLSDFR